MGRPEVVLSGTGPIGFDSPIYRRRSPLDLCTAQLINYLTRPQLLQLACSNVDGPIFDLSPRLAHKTGPCPQDWPIGDRFKRPSKPNLLTCP